MKILLAGHIEVSPFWDYLNEEKSGYKEWGQGGTQVSQIGVELLERDHSVVVVTLDERSNQDTVLKGENLRICIGPYRSRIRHRMMDVFRDERAYIRDAIVRESPDIIHANWTYEYALASINTRFPSLITIRDWPPTILFNTPPWPYRLLKMFMAMYVFGRGKHFTANSPYISEKTSNWFGWDIPVIPNALQDPLFYEGERDPDLCPPEFIAVNNGFGPRKNVRSLLRAFQIVRRNFPAAQLHLIGSSYGQGEEAHVWARSENLAENVSFRGKVPHDDVIAAVREADVLVHSAKEESFGNTLVEAMSQKTPVVAGRDSGAVPWVLNNGEAGVLTDVESPKRIAESMLEVTESEKKWTHYSEKGYNHAKEKFSLSKTVDKFVSTYRDLLSYKK